MIKSHHPPSSSHSFEPLSVNPQNANGLSNSDVIAQMNSAQGMAGAVGSNQAMQDKLKLVNHIPSSGYGQFDAEYHPEESELDLTFRLSFEFLTGPFESNPRFPSQDFEWKKKEKKKFKNQFVRDIEKTWSNQFPIHNTTPGQDGQTVNTHVQSVIDNKTPHFIIQVSKYPDDYGFAQSYVNHVHQDDEMEHRHGLVVLDSGDNTSERKLSSDLPFRSVWFKKGSDELRSDMSVDVNAAANELMADPKRNVEITGVAIKGESKKNKAFSNDMAIARQRSKIAAKALKKAGISKSRMRIINRIEGKRENHGPRATIWVIDRAMQNVSQHEVGHMLGLGDEIDGTDSNGNPLVISPGYAQMVKDQTGQIVERGTGHEGLMSSGGILQLHHYSPALEALKLITGSENWSL
ncbi:MAG: hypothetical protein VXZ96_00055 [Myxococcota bacterium]|nr:hypothetical protein [Myxococcota bacterium]